MELLDQTRLPQPRLANDQHELAATLPRPLPAPLQHADFLVATHEGGEVALPGATATAARPNDPEQRHVLGHALEFMAAALLDDEQPGDLPVYPRRHHYGTRIGQRLCPCRDVRHIAENLAARIEHRRASVDGDACGQCGLARHFVLAVQLA